VNLSFRGHPDRLGGLAISNRVGGQSAELVCECVRHGPFTSAKLWPNVTRHFVVLCSWA